MCLGRVRASVQLPYVRLRLPPDDRLHQRLDRQLRRRLEFGAGLFDTLLLGQELGSGSLELALEGLPSLPGQGPDVRLDGLEPTFDGVEPVSQPVTELVHLRAHDDLLQAFPLFLFVVSAAVRRPPDGVSFGSPSWRIWSPARWSVRPRAWNSAPAAY